MFAYHLVLGCLLLLQNIPIECCKVSTRAVGCALQIILEKWKKMLSVFAYPVVIACLLNQQNIQIVLSLPGIAHVPGVGCPCVAGGGDQEDGQDGECYIHDDVFCLFSQLCL